MVAQRGSARCCCRTVAAQLLEAACSRAHLHRPNRRSSLKRRVCGCSCSRVALRRGEILWPLTGFGGWRSAAVQLNMGASPAFQHQHCDENEGNLSAEARFSCRHADASTA